MVKYQTMIADHEDGGLKMLHIRAKFNSLKLAWVRRLNSENFHPWMIIPKYFLDTSSIFFPNTKPKIDKKLPIFYRQLLNSWLEISQNLITAETILSQLVWDNIFIKIDDLVIRKFNFL